MTDVLTTSNEVTPHTFPFWTSAVGADEDISDAFGGQPARYFYVAVGGLLNLKSLDAGSGTLHAVVAGQRYDGLFTNIYASGSTAYGLIFCK